MPGSGRGGTVRHGKFCCPCFNLLQQENVHEMIDLGIKSTSVIQRDVHEDGTYMDIHDYLYVYIYIYVYIHTYI